MANGFIGYGRFLEGDPDAFGDIVSEYGDRLLYFIRTYTNNITAAEDLMEDVFAELIIRKKKFDSEPEFRGYLYKTARNKALNYIKKESKYSGDPPPDDTPEERSLLNEHVLNGERKRLLSQCLDALKPEYRDVLYFVYFEDMSYEQAARVMRKTRKQVDNLVYRAKQAMKIELEKNGVYSVSDL